MRIILLGAPGAGKGTQARHLADFYHIPLIATGDILRAAVLSGSILGLKARVIMEEGRLVPDKIMINLIKERLTNLDCVKGYVLDGFPRTILQAEALIEAGIVIDFIIEINISDKDIVKRLSGRRVHLASGRVYHIENNPPISSNIDDITGDSLVLREDDKTETVQKRLQIYHEHTEPVIAFYKKLSCNNMRKPYYICIDGRGTIEEVNRKITENLLKYKKNNR